MNNVILDLTFVTGTLKIRLNVFGCTGLLSTLLIFILTKLLTWNEKVLALLVVILLYVLCVFLAFSC